MKIRLLILILFVLGFTELVKAQERDFGIWYGINGEYSLSKKLEIDISGNLRTYNRGKQVEQTFIESGVTWKFNKYLSVAGSYRFTEKVEKNLKFYPRHKLFVSVKGNLPAGNFLFSSRLMLQYQNKMYVEKLSEDLPDYALRIRLKTVYKIPAFPVNPYLYYESFSTMFISSTHIIDKERFSAGFNLKITSKHSVELEYIFQRDFEPKLSDLNIISINYNFKF